MKYAYFKLMLAPAPAFTPAPPTAESFYYAFIPTRPANDRSRWIAKLKLGLVACLILITGAASGQPNNEVDNPGSSEQSLRTALASDANGPFTANFFNDSTMRGAVLDWDYGHYQGTCAENEALLGISKRPASNGAGHLALCVRTGNAAAQPTAPLLNNGVQNRRIKRHGDWAEGYIKLECGKDEYAIGISQNPGATQSIHGLLCVAGPSGLDEGAIVMARILDAGDNIGSPEHGDWDHYNYKGQCITGEHVVGVSISPTGQLHSLLCSGRPTTVVLYKGSNGTWQGGASLNYGKNFEPYPFFSITSQAPSIVNFNGKIYYAYSSNGILCIRTSINRGWSISEEKCHKQIQIPYKPSLAAWRGRLYVVYQLPGAPSTFMFTSTFDGNTFDTPKVLSIATLPGFSVFTPSIAVFNGKIYAAYVGSSAPTTNVICVAQLFVDITPKCTNFRAAVEKPSIAAAFGTLYVGFRDTSFNTVFISSADPLNTDFVKKIDPSNSNRFRANTPLVMNFVQDHLLVAFTDVNSQLKVVRSDDGITFNKVSTSSFAAPKGSQAMATTEVSDTVSNVRFAVYGDMPYRQNDEVDFFGKLMPALVGGSNIPFVIHVGDIGRPGDGSGNDRFDSCSGSLRKFTLAQWNRLNRPLVFLPGDNDWTDCNPNRVCKGTPNCSSDLNPLNELKKVRTLFKSHTSLVQRDEETFDDGHSWSDGIEYDQHIAYLSLTIVGSDNGYVPPGVANATALNTAASARELATLDRINRIGDWLDDTNIFKALIVTMHVDLFHGESDWDLNCERRDSSKTRQPYKEICVSLKHLSNFLRLPVLIVHGDTNAHCFWKHPNMNLWVLNGPGDFTGVDADLVSFDVHNTNPFSVVSLLNNATPLLDDRSKCDYETARK